MINSSNWNSRRGDNKKMRQETNTKIIILIIFLFFIILSVSPNPVNKISAEANPIKRKDIESELSNIFISEDTTWNLSGSPYILDDTYIIGQGATLTIEPGVEVLFNGFYSIIVDGSLNATGTPKDPIIFSSNLPIPQIGDWESIYFRQSSLESLSIIKYANISYADKCIRIENSVIQIINNNIYNNTNGIYLEQLPNNGDIIIENNIIFNHSENGIYMWGETLGNVNVSVINNKIYSNGHSGVWPTLYFGAYIFIEGDYLRLNFQNNEIFNNYFDGINFNWCEDLYSLIFRNNSIYMNNGDGVILHYIYPHQSLDFQFNEIYNNSNSGVAMDHLGRADKWIKNFYFQYNKIYNNKNNGIISSINSIENFYFRFNEIFNNTNNGISITSTSYSIKSLFLQNNEIYNNTNGLYIDYWNEINFDMSKNNIYNNSIYAIECKWANPSNYVIASRNWWGTTNSNEIDQIIFDYYDDFSYAKVNYTPFLFSPILETYNAQPPQWSNLQINDTLIKPEDNVNISIEVTDNIEVDNVWIDIDETTNNMTNVVGTDTFYYIFIPTQGNKTFNYIIFMNDTSGT